MWFDHLETYPAAERVDLLGSPVAAAIAQVPQALVFTIDPELADTEKLCAALGLPLENSANAVLVAGKREGQERHACCMTLANRRLDVNGLVRQRLDVRKASFAPMDQAVAASGMEYGAITPIGLPDDWPVWVDSAVADTDWVCVGSGIRSSKLVVPGAALVTLPDASRVEDLARDIPA